MQVEAQNMTEYIDSETHRLTGTNHTDGEIQYAEDFINSTDLSNIDYSDLAD